MDNLKYVLWFFLISMLVGCQTQYSATGKAEGLADQGIPSPMTTPIKDGAPIKPMPVSFFKIFAPKNEPLSRYGNPSSYRVAGRTYSTLTSAKGYRERGLASWYGTKFHSQRTSSGEAYDMYALTAAHRTLPLPCYVRVKNLNNGRETVVKVNDRGPFHSNRIIDLSYAAAVKLGMLPKGTVPVEVVAVSSPGKAVTANYYLQAGAFKSRPLAESMRKDVAKLTSSRVFVEKYRQYYVVRIGPLADKRASDKLKTTLKNRGVQGVFSSMM